MHGNADLTNLSLHDSTQAWIHEMNFPMGEDGSSPVLDTISADDFSEGFKGLSENLSSSPSGWHIGHYKAAIGDEELCILYAGITSIPFKHGLTLPQWTSAIQVMLEKTKGCARIDKLHVVQLLEADLNMALWIIFGHRLIHRAEDCGTIPLSQWVPDPIAPPLMLFF